MTTLTERLITFNQQRDPQLLQRKYKVMSADAFAFYRGSCHLFYEDWPTTSPLNTAPLTWICGDLHLNNLGSYHGDDRHVYFHINDFDEAALAPCTWDLTRFLVSIHLSAPLLDVNEEQRNELCAYFLDKYAQALKKGHTLTIREKDMDGLIEDLLFHDGRNRQDLLHSRTDLTADGRQLHIDNKKITEVSKRERTVITRAIRKWSAEQENPPFFQILDIARRVAGVGSLGVGRYILLVEGKGSPEKNYLLDLKQILPSALEPVLQHPQPNWANEAERAVTVQRWVQGIPHALMAVIPLYGTHYILREIQPSGNKINIKLVSGKPDKLKKLIKTVAQVVAWGQLRCADRHGTAELLDLMQFARDDHWHKDILDYAQMYAQCVLQNYQEFSAAYDQGAFASDDQQILQKPAFAETNPLTNPR